MKSNIDSTDRQLIKQLSNDGRMPVNKLAESLNITPPTLYSRMKRLIQSGTLKIAGVIDTFKTNDLIMAVVAVKIDSGSKLDEKLEQIAALENVQSAVAVAGRFDIFADVVIPDMPALYAFMTQDLPALGDISASESFVVMKSKNKWILPTSLHSWFEKK